MYHRRTAIHPLKPLRLSLLIALCAALLAAPLGSVSAQDGPPEALPGLKTITYASQEESDFDQDAPEWVREELQALAERSFAAGGEEAAYPGGFVVQYMPANSNDGEYKCAAFPAQARAALEQAAAIWAALLNPGIPVVIQACWAEDMPDNVLGASGPSNWRPLSYRAAPFPFVYYPEALANLIQGRDLDPRAEIEIAFSQRYASLFDFSLDGQSLGGYHFATLSLHEIAHGLGMSGSLRLINGLVGRHPGANYPFIYDLYTTDAAGTLLYNYPFYPDPSIELRNAVEGQVYFTGPLARAANGGQRVPLFSPAPFRPGSSYVHLEQNYEGTINSLMTYSLDPGERNLNPGPITLGLLGDLGWSVVSISLSARSVAENQLAGTPVGMLATNPADGLSLSLPAGLGSNAQFDIQSIEGKPWLVTRAPLDYEAAPTRTVVVAASGPLGVISQQNFTIQVLDRNDPVTGILPSRSQVQISWPVGRVAAYLQAIDQDYQDEHVFSLLPAEPGEGGPAREGAYPDNRYFEISGNRLLLKEPLDGLAPGATLVVGLRVEDAAETYFEGPLEFTAAERVEERLYAPLTVRAGL